MEIRPSNTRKLRKRDFQFSLWRLLAATTLCAVLFSAVKVLEPPAIPLRYVAWVALGLVLLVLFGDWSRLDPAVGWTLMAAGEYRGAVHSFTRAINADPDDPERYCHRARAYHLLQNLEAAFVDYTKAISLDARYEPAWAGRASLEAQRGELQKAIDDASIALCVEPDNNDALLIRGSSYGNVGKIDDALEDLNQAIRIDPYGWQAYCLRGYAFLAAKKNSEAARDFDVSLQRGGDLPDVHGGLTIERGAALAGHSTALFNLGHYHEALQEIDDCRSRHPQSALAISIQAWFLATCPDDSLRDAKRALELAQAARDLSELDSWLAEASLGAAHAELGTFRQAVEHAQKALELVPAASRPDVASQLAAHQAGQPYRDHGTSQ